MTLNLHATPEEVMRAVEHLEEFARSEHLSDNTIFGLFLALEECGSNVVNHALEGDPQQSFRVSFKKTDSEFSIELRDHGPEFDPTAAPSRPLCAEENDLPGGWGIQLVRCYMDDVQYKRESGENVLRMI